MTIQYNIYKGDNSGGPVDYGSVVATVAGTSWTSSALPVESRTRFGVRAFDTETGLEDKNLDATITVVVDASGADASREPGSPSGLSAVVSGSGSARIRWAYLETPGKPDPDGFNIYANIGDTVNWDAAPVQVVTFTPMARDFSAILSGLAAGSTHAIGVRSSLAGVRNPAGVATSYVVPAAIGAVSGLAISTTNQEN